MNSNLPEQVKNECYVFLSYKSEEQHRAQMVGNCLRLTGSGSLHIWWDQDLQIGARWNEDLDRAVADAGCVVVLWSVASCRSPWVQQEAAVAKARGVLVHAKMEDCVIPEPYGSIQAANLQGWDGSDTTHREFVRLAAGVVSCVEQCRKKRHEGKGMKPVFCTILAALLVGVIVAVCVLWYDVKLMKTPSDEISSIKKTLNEMESARAQFDNRFNAAEENLKNLCNKTNTVTTNLSAASSELVEIERVFNENLFTRKKDFAEVKAAHNVHYNRLEDISKRIKADREQSTADQTMSILCQMIMMPGPSPAPKQLH